MESKRLGVKHWLFLLVLGSGLLLAGYWFSARRVPDPDFGSQASVVQLIYITKYSKCGDTATVTTDISRDGLEGLFASLSEDWSTMEEQDGKIELTKTVDDWCPNHNYYRLIKLYRGHVVVFRGQDPDEKFIIRGYKNLEESAIIHPQTLDQLRRGILLYDEDPGQLDILVRSYLEGITD